MYELMITAKTKNSFLSLWKGMSLLMRKFETYQVHHCEVDDLAVSVACLQVAGSVALP